MHQMPGFLTLSMALGSCTGVVMSLWCCALFDVQRKEQESKQGIISATDARANSPTRVR